MPRRLPWGREDSVPIYLAETRQQTSGSLDVIRERIRIVGAEASLLVFVTSPQNADRMLLAQLPLGIGRLTDVTARDVLGRGKKPLQVATDLARPYWVHRPQYDPYALPPYIRVEGMANERGRTTRFNGTVVHPFTISSQAIVRQHRTTACFPDYFISQANDNPSKYHPSAAYETGLAVAAYSNYSS